MNFVTASLFEGKGLIVVFYFETSVTRCFVFTVLCGGIREYFSICLGAFDNAMC